MTIALQGVIELIRTVVAELGPVPARTIEQDPRVVKACRSSKTKARRHIDRLLALGRIRTDQGQVPKFWVDVPL